VGPPMLTRVRRILSRPVSVDAMIEFAMWCALPYILVGLVFTFFNPDDVASLERSLQTVLPAGANLVAFSVVTLLRPLLTIAPGVCVL
jgi:hypothetical protein